MKGAGAVVGEVGGGFAAEKERAASAITAEAQQNRPLGVFGCLEVEGEGGGCGAVVGDGDGDGRAGADGEVNVGVWRNVRDAVDPCVRESRAAYAKEHQKRGFLHLPICTA